MHGIPYTLEQFCTGNYANPVEPSLLVCLVCSWSELSGEWQAVHAVCPSTLPSGPDLAVEKVIVSPRSVKVRSDSVARASRRI